MPEIGRRDIVMLLLGVDSAGQVTEGIGGMTRLQKLLFLLEREQGLKPSGDGFSFVEYKAGPYSSKLYDDLEFLENLGLIEGQTTAEATEQEAAELDFTFEELIGPSEEKGKPEYCEAPDAYEERTFSITERGRQKIQKLLNSAEYKPFVDRIRRIKSKYGHYSLNDLLYYVYSKYPEMTTESEIKEKVLRQRFR
jgi:uncharacterized protein